ncbi:MAG: hypothetical protein WDW38_000375 [Sanguina aurantia]
MKDASILAEELHMAEHIRQNGAMNLMVLEAFARAQLVVETAHTRDSRITVQQLTDVNQLQQRTNVERLPLPDWADVCASVRASHAARNLPSQYARSVAAYTAFVTTALTRLAQLGAAPAISDAQADEVSMIWDVLTEGGMCHSEWPLDWPDVSPTTRTALHAAVDTLVTWQLAFTRSSSRAWARMRSSMPPAKLQLRMFRAVSAALSFIHPLLQEEDDELRLAVFQLPPSFIPNLCSLAIEQLGPGLCRRAARPRPVPYSRDIMYGVPYSHVFASLVSIVCGCLLQPTGDGNRAMTCQDPRVLSFLCPAMFETAKLALVACVAGFNPIAHDQEHADAMVEMHTHQALGIMLQILDLGRHVAASAPAALLPSSNPGSLHLKGANGNGTSSVRDGCGGAGSSSGVDRGGGCTALAQSHLSCETVSLSQALETLGNCGESLSGTALLVIGSWLRAGALTATASSPPQLLPCLMTALRCALCQADAWVCKDLPLLLSAEHQREMMGRPHRHPRRLVVSPAGDRLVKARRVMVELLPLLHRTLLAESPTSMQPACFEGFVIRAWLLMPGSASNLEALLRDSHQPQGLGEIAASVVASARFLLATLHALTVEQQLQSIDQGPQEPRQRSSSTPVTLSAGEEQAACGAPSQALLSACTHLAATLRKLLTCQVLSSSGSHSDLSNTDKGRGDQGVTECAAKLIEVLDSPLLCTARLQSGCACGSVRPVNGTPGSTNGACRSSTTTTTSSSSSSSSSSSIQVSSTATGSATSNSVAPSDSAAPGSCLCHSLARFRAVLILALAQALSKSGKPPQQCHQTRIGDPKLHAQEQRLEAFMSELLPATSLIDSTPPWVEVSQGQMRC